MKRETWQLEKIRDEVRARREREKENQESGGNSGEWEDRPLAKDQVDLFKLAQ